VTTAAWLLPAVLLPAVLGLGLFWPRLRGGIVRVLPFSSWPLLAAAVLAFGSPPTDLPWLMLGVRVGVDPPALMLIAAGTLIWTVAGLYIVRHFQAPWFLGAALATQAGSLGALVTFDPIGFYFFFSLMTVASYGLVVAGRSRRSHDAGRLYLGLALVGEMLILAGFLIGSTAPEARSLTAALLVAGFGAKLGLPAFHIALPVAYRAAPYVGGALLSSVLVNAAIFGVLRFLPPDGGGPGASGAMALIILGLLMAFGGAMLGIVQRDARALLGYSTASQMGIALSAIGIGAGHAGGIAATAPAVALFAAHHGLVKAALFLGLGALPLRQDWRLGFLLVLSLSLAAAPLTGGALAKLWVESAADHLPAHWAGAVHWLLPLTSTATALLMVRFLGLVMRLPATRMEPGGRVADLLGLGLAAVVLPWAAFTLAGGNQQLTVLTPAHLWLGVWPLLLALLIALPSRLGMKAAAPPPPPASPGLPVAELARRPALGSARRHQWATGVTASADLLSMALLHMIVTEGKMRSFPRFGVLFLGLAAACGAALLL